MSTSDFPLILADSIGKALRGGYESEPSSHREFCRVAPVRDFKVQTRPLLGSAPALLPVLELGEFTQGSLSEDAATYSVSKFGRVIALSFETLTNDDAGAFLRVVPAMGMAARRAEADALFALFALNGGSGPTMGDAVAMFDAAHANVTASAAALDAAALGAARTLLRKQTSLGGGLLNAVPRTLLVPAELETVAEILLASATRVRLGSADQATDGARPEWIGQLQLVAEARLADSAAYLLTDSAQVDHFELGVLEEMMGGPTVVREDSFLTDASAWRVKHVFGVAALDYRGAVQIPIS
jgi:hypothetical protein